MRVPTTKTSIHTLFRAGILPWMIAACVIACVQADGTKPANPAVLTEQFVTGEIIVQFRAGTTDDQINAILGATGTRIKRRLGSPLIYLIATDEGASVDATIRRLADFPEVRSSEPNQVIRLDPP